MNFEDTQFPEDFLFSHTNTVNLTGRPVRDTAIDHNDILDLKIALSTTNDVSDFLAVIK